MQIKCILLLLLLLLLCIIVVVIGPPALAGSPSVLPFVWAFLLVFSKFWHDARNPYEVVRDRASISRKIVFAPKIGKMGQKQGFLNILIY